MRANEHLDHGSRVALRELGTNLRIARQRRGRRIVDWAQAMSVGESTVKRMEAGDPNVSIGTYVAALQLLGRDRVGQLVNVANPDLDVEGRHLERLDRPHRIRRARRKIESYAF